MALETGTQLGHYEITEQIGKGGMGEVYRARDTKLGREVAIKVLPSEFSRDEERLARLEREARMLAALNHPNIAAIHGLEEFDDTRFLVLELVEGDTLADRLKRGAIPVEESLKLALQIAEALEAAHEKGVIHRDLKPANIKVTPQGRVKVLDFGLAKAFIGDQADVNLSNSPTLSMAATQAGMILGTAAYMSPEQASGEGADHRADVWSFGVVLFEMLSGRQLFTGKTASHVMGAVLDREPDWDSLPPNLHPRIRMLLEGCLEKEPKDRLTGISDARVNIQKAVADPDGVIGQPVAGGTPVDTQSRLRWVGAVVLAALGAVVGTLVLRPLPAPEPSLVSRWDHLLPEGIGFRNTGRSAVAASPDGSRFVYNGTGGLYLRSLNESEARIISGTEAPLTNPVFSPDGEWLAYWSVIDQQLKKIAVVGGAEVTLTELALNPTGMSWEEDGRILYGAGADGVWGVSSDGGVPVQLFSEAVGIGFPQLIPQARAILFTTVDGQIGVHSIDSDESSLLFPGFQAKYVDTGHLVYGLDGVLFAVGFDTDSLQPTGGPVPLLEGVQGEPFQYAVSDTGTLIYVKGAAATGVENGILTWVSRTGEREPLPLEPRPYRHPRLSPDGSRLAVETTDAGGQSDIWLYSLNGGTAMQRMPGDGNNSRPVWTPDGERLIFTSDRDGEDRIYSQLSNLSGVAEPLTEPEEGVLQWPDTFTPDGGTLSFTKFGASIGGNNVWTLSMEEGAEPVVFEGGGGGGSSFSPDGRWLAYRGGGGDTQNLELYIEPFPQTGVSFQLTENTGSYPLFSRDGREMFYRRGLPVAAVGGVGGGTRSQEFIAVDISLDVTPPVWTNERVLPIQGFQIFSGYRDYDITPDGERLLMIFPDVGTDVLVPVRPSVSVVQNWFEEIRGRVPVP